MDEQELEQRMKQAAMELQRLKDLRKKSINKAVTRAVDNYESSTFPPKLLDLNNSNDSNDSNNCNNSNEIEDNKAKTKETTSNTAENIQTDEIEDNKAKTKETTSNTAENIKTDEISIHTPREANDFVRHYMQQNAFEMNLIDFISSNYLICDEKLEELSFYSLFKNF